MPMYANWQSGLCYNVTMNKLKYSKDELLPVFARNATLAGVLRDLDLRPVGGNYMTIKRYVQRYSIDISHFVGQSWNTFNYKPFESLKSKSSLKLNLIRKNGNSCYNCNLSKWLDRDITLELEHIDGNPTNNIEENLMLLCPNCHSYTSTWRRSKREGGVTGSLDSLKNCCPNTA